MIVITAPERCPMAQPTVFLAGGITNCPDWQQDVISLLKNQNVTLFNPRREHFDVTDPSASKIQIEWEFDFLRAANAVLFWFAGGSLNPIALFEYGKELGRNTKNLFVGCDLSYSRRLDVIEQTRLARPNLIIHDSILTLSNEVIGWLTSGGK